MKSVSSLLAGVILIALTISVAYITSSTVSSLVQSQSKISEESSTICLSSFQITNAYCSFSKPSVLNSTKILLNLDNSLKE